MSKPTQCERLLEYLELHDSITQLEALNKLGIMRLASRISDLRKQGYNIVTESVKVKTRHEGTRHVASYKLGDSNGTERIHKTS